MKCKDHLGNEFNSKKDMCEYYGIDYHHVYWKRLKKGCSLEKILTTPVRKIKRAENPDRRDKSLYSSSANEYYELYKGSNGCCTDHLGNSYVHADSMCRCWGISRNVFFDRLSNGWSLDKALTYHNDVKVPDTDKFVIWVFGEPFPNYEAIDAAYGYTAGRTSQHKDNLEEWLMERQRFFVDGKLFSTYYALTEEYGLSGPVISGRLSRGWTLDDAVHTPLSTIGRKGIRQEDHLGNEYESLAAMLLHYGITRASYRARKKRGWGLEKILTTPMKKCLTKEPSKVANVIK